MGIKGMKALKHIGAGGKTPWGSGGMLGIPVTRFSSF